MILTIGYQNLRPAELLSLATQLDATVIDVRGSLSRCKSGFGPRQLEALLGDRYQWRGDKGLGNRHPNYVTDEGIAWLAEQDRADRVLILMCQEEAPGECHRHNLIATALLPLGVDALHICDDEVVSASDLERAMRSDSDYDCVSLESFLSTASDLEEVEHGAAVNE